MTYAICSELASCGSLSPCCRQVQLQPGAIGGAMMKRFPAYSMVLGIPLPSLSVKVCPARRVPNVTIWPEASTRTDTKSNRRPHCGNRLPFGYTLPSCPSARMRPAGHVAARTMRGRCRTLGALALHSVRGPLPGSCPGGPAGGVLAAPNGAHVATALRDRRAVSIPERVRAVPFVVWRVVPPAPPGNGVRIRAETLAI